MSDIPDGFDRVNVQEAYINRTTGQIILLGIPEDDHNCDAMGCGSLDHVIARGTINNTCNEAKP